MTTQNEREAGNVVCSWTTILKLGHSIIIEGENMSIGE